jgi:RNA-directed DNA polymerase
MQSNSICRTHKKGLYPISQWSDINWKIIESRVNKLKRRIFVAKLTGNSELVRILQVRMIKSKANLLYSIRRVTSINRGKKTAGIDKQKYLSPDKRLLLFLELSKMNLLEWTPPPVRREYIARPGKEPRPLGIPTIKDRVVQQVVKSALEPEWEVLFEPGSYGFRPARGCHDAMSRLWRILSSKKRTWVLDADIKGCFNNIAHDPLLQKLSGFPAQSLVSRWLKAGYFEKDQYFDTLLGTPQGGIISPLLANIALHGMEEALGIRYHVRGYVIPTLPFILVRYADDFVVLTTSEANALKAKSLLGKFLADRGMEFSENKTTIRNVENESFDFLGWSFGLYDNNPLRIRRKAFKRATGGKVTLITPSKKAIESIKSKIKLLFKSHVSSPTHMLINKLNPIIVGWANYHRYVNANKTFRSLDNFIYLQVIRWAKRRHVNKSWEWIVRRYFTSSKVKFKKKTGKSSFVSSSWTFCGDNGFPKLVLFRQQSLKNFASIGFGRNPLNPKDVDYFKDRKLSMLFEKDSFRSSVYKKQYGRCPVCGLNLAVGDWDEPVHLHHLIPRKNGGKDLPSNLMLLHEECHYAIHSKQISKAEMLCMLYSHLCRGLLAGQPGNLGFEEKVRAFNSIISDKEAWSVVDRVKAASELSSLTSSGIPSKRLRKESLQAFNSIISNPVAFSLLKSFYEAKNSSISQQVTLVEDDSTTVA